jgi:hypothetical protein
MCFSGRHDVRTFGDQRHTQLVAAVLPTLVKAAFISD